MNKKEKVIAILLAYNAQKTLEHFYNSLPKHLFDEILLFDDASADKTFEIAQRLKIQSYKNPANLGYGGNLKKALKTALSKSAAIIVDIHPDGEYLSDSIKLGIDQVKKGSNLVLGNRFFSFPYILKESGMFKWKIFPIVVLNFITKILLQTKVSDLHQGFRIYSKSLLNKINFEANSNNYIFSLEIISQAQFKKFKITEIPIKTNYRGNKRGASFLNSLRYTISTFRVIFLFLLAKIGIKNTIFIEPKKNE